MTANIPDSSDNNHPMALALAEARSAAAAGDVPVGAVLVARDGRILASAGNRVEQDSDPTAHAELVVLRMAAAAGGRPRLPGGTLYVTLEPCPMCAQAISFARLRRVVFAAYDPKGGGIEHGPRLYTQPTCHHRPEVVGGVRESEAAQLLKDFFAPRRSQA
ncbi:MAG: nucleoside deaminase [Alphaproteobacteria bacterium]